MARPSIPAFLVGKTLDRQSAPEQATTARRERARAPKPPPGQRSGRTRACLDSDKTLSTDPTWLLLSVCSDECGLARGPSSRTLTPFVRGFKPGYKASRKLVAREIRLRERSRVPSHLVSELRVVGQTLHSLSKRFRIVRRYCHAALVSRDQLAQPSGIIVHHGQPRGEIVEELVRRGPEKEGGHEGEDHKAD